LDVDAAVGLRKKEPQDAVGEDADAEEDRRDNEESTDEDRVDAPAVSQTARHAADPAVRAASDAEAANPAEEV
jgi:hypothetical protein